MPIILALRNLRQEDCQFEPRLVYIILRLSQNSNNKNPG
jgi:hypothetical protein